MRTTLNQNRVPRLLIRIAKEERSALSEKTIITNEGIATKLYLNTPWEKPKGQDGDDQAQDNNKLSVRYGTIIGLSEGICGYKKGDIAILDYTVDIDDSYLVKMDNGDKIVSVPCKTTLCDSELIATTYDKDYIERNVIVHKPGEVDQLSLVLGIVRNSKFIPNDHYVFCEPHYPEPQSLILFTPAKTEETHVQRTVIFSPKNSGLKPGQDIVAILNSNMPLIIAGRPLEIIPITDILGVVEYDENTIAWPKLKFVE